MILEYWFFLSSCTVCLNGVDKVKKNGVDKVNFHSTIIVITAWCCTSDQINMYNMIL